MNLDSYALKTVGVLAVVSPFVLCSPVWLGPFACVLFVWQSAPLLPFLTSLPPAVGPVWCPGPVCSLVRLGIWLHL